MKEFIIGAICAVFGFLFGFAIKANNSIDEDEHIAICKDYDMQIQFYQDYIDGIDKVVRLDTIDNGALEILRNKLPNNQNSNE